MAENEHHIMCLYLCVSRLMIFYPEKQEPLLFLITHQHINTLISSHIKPEAPAKPALILSIASKYIKANTCSSVFSLMWVLCRQECDIMQTENVLSHIWSALHDGCITVPVMYWARHTSKMLRFEIGYVCTIYFISISWMLYPVQILTTDPTVNQTDPTPHQDDGQGETSQTKPISAAPSAAVVQVGLNEGWQEFVFFKKKKLLKLLFLLALIPAICQDKCWPWLLFHFLTEKFDNS